VVEDAVGTRAAPVQAWCRFLDELAGATVDIVGQHTLLAVADAVVEEESVLAQVGLGDTVLADVVEVTSAKEILLEI